MLYPKIKASQRTAISFERHTKQKSPNLSIRAFCGMDGTRTISI
jgi:hypothetical protein